MLSRDELTRYSRHILLPQIRREGQEKLKAARVTIVGAGGLGSPVALYLAAAGVGRLRIIDSDTLDLTNLQRQVLFRTSDLEKPKAERAREYLRELNPEIEVEARRDRLRPENARELLGESNLVVETTDNFQAKFLVNDACVLLGIPAILAGILRFEGQVLAVNPRVSACYRCVFVEPPPAELTPTCAEAGVLGAIAGIIGSMQAAEALKILCGVGEPLYGRMIVADALTSEFRRITLPRNPRCSVCGDSPSINTLIEENYAAPVCETPVGFDPANLGRRN